jgi:hemerythrin superfamily protein
MDAIDFLKQEHKTIKAKFNGLYVNTDTSQQRRKKFMFLMKFLKVHEGMEETEWYPSLLKKNPNLRKVIQKEIHDEKKAAQTIKLLVAKTRSDPNFDAKQSWWDKILNFEVDVLKHAEHEEHQLFPRVRKSKNITKAILMTLKTKMQRYKQQHLSSSYGSKQISHETSNLRRASTKYNKSGGVQLRPLPPPIITKVNFIQGPMGCTQDFSRKYRKMIYMFGDIHTHLPECKYPPGSVVQSIAEYLKSVLLENPDKMIDVYVEDTFISDLKSDRSDIAPTEEKFGTGYMTELFKTWDQCVQVDKSQCPFKNLRMHYVDVRSAAANIPFSKASIELEEAIEGIYNTWQFRLEHYSGVAMDMDDQDSFKAAIDQLEQQITTYSKDLNMLKAQITALKIDKQINNIKDLALRQAVTDYFLTNGYFRAQVTKSDIAQVVTQLRSINLNKPLQLVDREPIANLFRKAVSAEAWLVDAYSMARLFRTYEDGEESRFAIFYLGDNHIVRDRKFLKQIGFERLATYAYPYTKTATGLESAGNLRDVQQCIDLATFYQPFFQDQYSNFIANYAKQKLKKGGYLK